VKTRMLTVVADADALAETAAERIVARVTQRTGPLAMCFTGGSTPERLYALVHNHLLDISQHAIISRNSGVQIHVHR
jgi:6-phosphogluconolactonase/glucosamine-6-phosphate isomerase/deaminase